MRIGDRLLFREGRTKGVGKVTRCIPVGSDEETPRHITRASIRSGLVSVPSSAVTDNDGPGPLVADGGSTVGATTSLPSVDGMQEARDEESTAPPPTSPPAPSAATPIAS